MGNAFACCCKKTLDNNKPCIEIDNNTMNISCCTKRIDSHNKLSPIVKRNKKIKGNAFSENPKNIIFEI